MRRFAAALLASIPLALSAAWPAAAQQQQFNVGDQVTVGSTGETGTVIAVGQTLANGGMMIKVHLDKFGSSFPDQGAWYDTTVSRVTAGGGGGGQQPAAPQAAPGVPAAPQAPVAPPPQQPAQNQPQQPAGGGGPFNVGDHVTIGSTGDTGTVIAVGDRQANGGYLVKIHLDKLPPGYADQGGWYDSVQSRVTPGG